MFRFLHAADLHLDSPMRGLDRYEGAPVDVVRTATRRALENLVALAIAEQVAFVVIAGDLYDGDWRDHNTGLHLAGQMAKLREAGISVYLVQGNHDAASRLTKHLAMPDNVHLFPVDRPDKCVLSDLDVVIHGQGFAHAAVERNLSEAYPDRVPGAFNIGLLHTCATVFDGHERYAPCSLDDLRAKGYQYWALGHIHKREQLHDDPPIVFPGNIQGRHVRETGPKGCMLVTVDDAFRVRQEFRELDVVRWEVCKVDGEGASDGDHLLERFTDRLDTLLNVCADRVLSLRVEFTGRSRAHDLVAARPEDWINQVRLAATQASRGQAWVEKVLLHTQPLAEPLEQTLDGPRGELLQLISELRDDPSRLRELAGIELADLRKKMPPDVLTASDVLRLDDPGRLAELLDQVLPLLLDRIG